MFSRFSLIRRGESLFGADQGSDDLVCAAAEVPFAFWCPSLAINLPRGISLPAMNLRKMAPRQRARVSFEEFVVTLVGYKVYRGEMSVIAYEEKIASEFVFAHVEYSQ